MGVAGLWLFRVGDLNGGDVEMPTLNEDDEEDRGQNFIPTSFYKAQYVLQYYNTICFYGNKMNDDLLRFAYFFFIGSANFFNWREDELNLNFITPSIGKTCSDWFVHVVDDIGT